MKKNWFVVVCVMMLIVFAGQAQALTYLPEDAARGGMWANTLVDTSAAYKDGNGNFRNGPSLADPHNLLGPIPENQGWYAPTHTSVTGMGGGARTWAMLSFSDQAGQTLRVNNDPTNPQGYDGIVWGNAFFVKGEEPVWSEPGTIYLSQDGETWWKLPPWFEDPYDSRAYGNHQTFDHTPGNGAGLVSPGAPLDYIDGEWKETGLAGGDAFDMSTAYYVGDWTDSSDDNPDLVGLEWFSYILLTGESAILESEDDPLYSGPDPDSVYVFSTSHVPVPSAFWLLAGGLLGLSGIRRAMKA